MKSVFPNFRVNLLLAMVFGFLLLAPTPLRASSETGDDPGGLLHQPPMGAEHGGQQISNFFGTLAGTRGSFWDIAKAECAKYGWGRLAVYLLLQQALIFLGTWGVSRLLAKERGTLKNNAVYYLYSLLFSAVFLGTVYGCVVTRLWLGIVLVLIPLGIAGFVLVMKTFRIGFWRTVAFFLCCNIVSRVEPFIARVIVSQGKPLPWEAPIEAFVALPRSEQQATAERISEMIAKGSNGSPTATAIASSPAPASPATASTGPADLQAMYSRLQAERTTLDTNNAVAVAQFNQHAAEYTALNRPLAKSAAPRPASSPAPAKRPVKIAH